MSIRLQHVTKRFSENGSPAVLDVSFEAPSGAITSLIGPSGAGKSTILRLIAGLEVADEGQLFLAGEEASQLPAQKRGVGLVFQNYALFQNLTVSENVAFGLTVRKKARAEIDARVEELLALVQLQDKGTKYPSELSGGQRQRIAFARALAISPKVLLLDEPFGALDTRVRAELREWLEAVHQETKVTTLLVTHDQEEALELAQHVVLMMGGRVAQAGLPRELYDSPATPEVARFLGASVLHADGTGGRVSSYVRPEDLRLSRSPKDSGDVRAGIVRRLRTVGPRVKISLDLPTGETISVELSREETEALELAVGEQVFVDIGAARIFHPEFVI